jgi:hypothetical protein
VDKDFGVFYEKYSKPEGHTQHTGGSPIFVKFSPYITEGTPRLRYRDRPANAL